jgi:hypothetical protein
MMSRSKKHPVLENRGVDFDWDNINWDDPDAGEYTNLCPDNNRKLFEYGARCVAGIAQTGDIHKLLVPKSPSKIDRELERLYDVLNDLSLGARAALNFSTDLFRPFDGTVERIQRIVRKALESEKETPPKRDEARAQLGRNASGIWHAHGGEVSDKSFVDFVDRLIQNAGFDSDDKKSRVSCDTLVREVRTNVAENGAPSWQLF